MPDEPASDERRVECPYCEGGRIYHSVPGYRIRPWGPESLDWDEHCDHCNGTGGIAEDLPLITDTDDYFEEGFAG